MSREPLRDRNNQTIGYIETMSDGKQRLTDRNNVTLGYYDPKNNRTTDRNNLTVGYGNLLGTLLGRR
jgi:hypothetical protein